MFVLPRNLILLVKQVQIATLELYRMQYAYMYVYITQMRISYRWQQGKKGIQKVNCYRCLSLHIFSEVQKLVVCYNCAILEGGFYLPAYLYIYYLWSKEAKTMCRKSVQSICAFYTNTFIYSVN